MTYVRHVPSPPLNCYIEHFYYLDGTMPYPHEKILPVPSIDLKINLGSAFHVYREDPEILKESWIVGLYGTHHTIKWPTKMRFFGVRFKPNGAYPFLRLPMSELYNQVVCLDAIWGQFASEIREQLDAAPTIQAGLVLFERLMCARLYEMPHEQDIVEYGIAELEQHHGTLSIRELSDRIGVSQNHLGTLFKRVVGTPVKELARLYRFAYVLQSVDPTTPVDWTLITQRCGYYDQSHLNKDFLAFTGHNPTDYLHLRRQVYLENAQVDQLFLRNLPIGSTTPQQAAAHE